MGVFTCVHSSAAHAFPGLTIRVVNTQVVGRWGNTEGGDLFV